MNKTVKIILKIGIALVLSSIFFFLPQYFLWDQKPAAVIADIIEKSKTYDGSFNYIILLLVILMKFLTDILIWALFAFVLKIILSPFEMIFKKTILPIDFGK